MNVLPHAPSCRTLAKTCRASLGVCPTGALTIEEREAPDFDAEAAEKEQAARGPTHLAQTCFRCGNSEDDAVLFPCRHQGKSQWVCVRYLPPLIHG